MSDVVPSNALTVPDVPESVETLRVDGFDLASAPPRDPLGLMFGGACGYVLILAALAVFGDHNRVVAGFGEMAALGGMILSTLAFLAGTFLFVVFPANAPAIPPWSLRVDDDLTVGLVHRGATIETWSYSPEEEVEALERVVELRGLVDERNRRWQEDALAAHREGLDERRVAERLRAAAG